MMIRPKSQKQLCRNRHWAAYHVENEEKDSLALCMESQPLKQHGPLTKASRFAQEVYKKRWIADKRFHPHKDKGRYFICDTKCANTFHSDRARDLLMGNICLFIRGLLRMCGSQVKGHFCNVA